MFSEALRERFPTIKYLIYSGSRIPPCSLSAFDSLTDVPGETTYIVVPDSSDWRPVPGFDPQDGGWIEFKNIPRHGHLHYQRSVWDWSFYGSPRISYDPPTINYGEIFGSYEPWNPEHKTFLSIVRRVWRIIGELTTNRCKCGHPLGNKLMDWEVQLMEDAKGGDIWLGHHALEWCRAHPRRMLCGSYRACDDWQPPQSEWYRGLRRRIDERYGADFGDTPPPPGELETGHNIQYPSVQPSVIDAEAVRRSWGTATRVSAREND